MSAAQLMADLRHLRSLSFSACSAKATGWNGHGQGSVHIETPSPEVIVFRETGQWQPAGREDRPPLQFSNTYRWTIVDPQTVRLEHLRLGPEQPVFLVDLQPAPGQAWVSTTPHECIADLYALTLSVQPNGITLHWTITGPKKDEQLTYQYAFGA
jgi:hypothetical protein